MVEMYGLSISEDLLTFIIHRGILPAFRQAIVDANRGEPLIRDIDEAFTWMNTVEGQDYWLIKQGEFLGERATIQPYEANVLSIILDQTWRAPEKLIPYKTEPMI